MIQQHDATRLQWDLRLDDGVGVVAERPDSFYEVGATTDHWRVIG